MRHARIALAAAVVAMVALTAQAHVFDLKSGSYDSGWQVSAPSLLEVNVTVDGGGIDADGKRFVAIQISKKFRFGMDPDLGTIPAIDLLFTQKSSFSDAMTAERIYISQEAVANHTGVEWNGFSWILMRHGTAGFNEAKTNVTTDPFAPGWQIYPFTAFAWTVDDNLDAHTLTVTGGVIQPDAPGSSFGFYPGIGTGSLVIDVDLGVSEPARFTLKELAFHIPEPATLALLGLGGLGLLRRRRA